MPGWSPPGGRYRPAGPVYGPRTGSGSGAYGRRDGPPGVSPGRDPLGWLAGAAVGAAGVAWGAAALTERLGGPACRVAPWRQSLRVLVTALADPGRPVAGTVGCHPDPALFWVAAAITAVIPIGLWAGTRTALIRWRARGARSPNRPARHPPARGWGRRPWGRSAPDGLGQPAGGAHWAGRGDLRPLLVAAAVPGRVVLGRWRRHLVAAEARQSVLVVGPTQTMKTSGFAVPALLEWNGPVLAASVKTDLLRDTRPAREAVGRVWVYDPAACTGLPAHGWSPLAGARTWSGARRTAAAMVDAARSTSPGPADADFWYATSAKLLAPLLLAAAVSGRTMADVVRWVDTQETAEVVDLLAAAGVEEAVMAAEASFGREERARSSVFTTTETILDPFADPGVAESESRAVIDPAPLLDGGRHTLYLCAPAHEQRRLRPLFSALVDQVVRSVYERAALSGAPLDPPLLVVLDEAASIAPLEDLDGLAATGAGQGIQLVTVWQDLAQIGARYGGRAASVVNNHRAKVILSGLSDVQTLDSVSALVGDSDTPTTSSTLAGDGSRTTTESTSWRRLVPGDSLRRIPPGHALLLYGHLPPAPLRLRPWFAERDLQRRVRSLPGPVPDEERGPRSRFRGWKRRLPNGGRAFS